MKKIRMVIQYIMQRNYKEDSILQNIITNLDIHIDKINVLERGVLVLKVKYIGKTDPISLIKEEIYKCLREEPHRF